MPSTLDNLVIKYVHTSLGHLGVDKCLDQFAHSFHIKNLGSKIRNFIARCDTCQRVKYLNKAYRTQERSYLLAKQEICVHWTYVELYHWREEALGIYLYATAYFPNT